MARITNIVAFLPRLLIYVVLLWPLKLVILPERTSTACELTRLVQIFGFFRSGPETRKVDRALWQALEDARTYDEWQEAAEALNEHDAPLMKWKSEPQGPYEWDTILQR